MSKFVTGVCDFEVKEYRISILIGDMYITLLMNHAQQNAVENLMGGERRNKRDRVKELEYGLPMLGVEKILNFKVVHQKPHHL